MNFADSRSIKTPELVPLRDSPVDTYDEPDSAGVATGILDEYRVWLAKLCEIGGTAATHDDPTQISETQKCKQLIKNIDYERFKTLERENIEREKIKRENIERENIETPELVHLRESPVDTYDEPDNAGVATGIWDEDRVRLSKLREIGGTAATHDDPTQISETQKLKQLIKNIDFEIFKKLERENMEL